ncbi:hypothetical protein PB2503_12864 [Parvularcula bermudensis HTCC2503]|uniref:Peptide ABC transporter permease n=1 Tax=Parvularcula bermudensis (strain ATCC BAA-594 / HTCC2503 / KCTC 12087) TaxID=314260 RepID=E0TG39_PARBH|nr:ABC transporter permease [Parvularcula bermudensis]ADM10610.1 hypothetical protein PB2503_12864 [Parvularcula bermudensis HTCC2503]
MAGLLTLAFQSLLSRKTAALLSVISVALSVTLFLGVDKLRRAATDGFESTISGTDLIVGPRAGGVNLLLYTVFRVGEPTGSVSWESYEMLRDQPGVAWTIPLSLGDSHQGFRVVGTDRSYLDHYQYGAGRHLSLAAGEWFDGPKGAVLGAKVADRLDYDLGTELTVSHGLVSAGFAEHEGHKFRVVGSLAPTGTPVDRSIHVSLAGIEALHGDPGASIGAGNTHEHEHEHEHDGVASPGDQGEAHPEALSAFLVGLENRTRALVLQRQITTYEGEPLTAVLPGLALSQLWSVVGTVETVLFAISLFVVGTGFVSMMIALLTSLATRQRELAVLRAAGAGPGHIFGLLIAETATLATLGTLIGAGLTATLIATFGEGLAARNGIPLAGLGASPTDLGIALAVIGVGTALGTIPAMAAYRRSLADGLSPRL